MDDLDLIEVYTDGAASGNPGPGGYAFVIIGEGIYEEKSWGEKFTTNNRMELMAVIAALESLLEHKTKYIVIHSDSTYVVKAINERWLFSWLATGFKKKKNEDLWRRFYQLYQQFEKLEFRWVRGHDGNTFNERCDKLARKRILDTAS